MSDWKFTFLSKEAYERLKDEPLNLLEEIQRSWSVLEENESALQNQESFEIRQKDSLNQRLAEEVEALSQRVQSLNNENSSLRKKLGETENSEISIQYTLSQELVKTAELSRTNQWLREQLQEKAELLLQAQSAQEAKQSQLNTERNQVRELETRLTALRTQFTEENDSLTQKLKIANERNDELKNHLLNEANTNAREVEAFRKLEALFEQSTLEFETQKEEDLRKNDQEDLEKAKQEISDLKGALQAEISPRTTEPQVPPALPTLPSTGLLSSLQTRYEEAARELNLARNEKRHFEILLNRLLEDLEEKAPLMAQQRTEYEQLSKAALQENTKLGTENQKSLGQLSSLRKTITDLDSQVLLLLGELENRSAAAEDRPPLGFASIQELQHLNRELLTRVHELEDSGDADATAEALQAAKHELTELKAIQDRNASTIRALVLQRESYKEMAAAARGSWAAGTTAPALPQSAQVDTSAAEGMLVKELKEQCENYKEHVASLTAQVDQWRDQSSQLKLAEALASTKLQTANERVASLSETVERQRKTIDQLQEQRADRTYSNNLEEQLRIQQQQAAKAQAAAEESRQAREEATTNLALAKASEGRLLKDNEGLRNQISRLQSLLDSVQQLQNAKQSSDEQARAKLEAEVESLTQGKALLKKELNDSQATIGDLSAQLRAVTAEAERELNEAEQRQQRTQTRMAQLETEKLALEVRLEELKDQMTKADSRLSLLLEREGEKESLRQLDTLQLSLDNLKDELRLSKESSDSWKNIAKEAEQINAELTATNKDLRSSLETRSREAEVLGKRVQSFDELYRESEQQHQNALAGLKAELLTKEQELRRLEQEIFAAQTERNGAVDEAERSRANAQRHQSLAEAADANYKREVVQHSATVSENQQLKTELNQVRQELTEARAREKRAISELATKQAAIASRENALQQQIDDLNTSWQEARVENEELQKEMVQLSEKVLSVEKSVADPSLATGDSREAVALKYLQRQNEILVTKFELLQVFFLISSVLQRTHHQAEKERFAQTARHSTQLVDEMKQRLRDAQEGAVRQARSTQEQERLLQDVQQLALVRESNAALRSENEQVRQEAAKLRQKIETMEKQMQPLLDERSELRITVETREEEIKSLVREVDNWRSRVTALMSKYEAVDPEVHRQLNKENEVLKKDVEQLKKNIAETRQELETLRPRCAELQSQVEALTKERDENGEKLKQTFELAKTWKERANNDRRSLQEAQKGLEENKKQLEDKDAQLASKSAELAAKEAAPAETPATPSGSVDLTALQGQLEEKDKRVSELAEQLAAETAKAQEVSKLREEIKSALTKALTQGQELNKLRRENAELQTKLGTTTPTAAAPAATPTPAAAPVQTTPTPVTPAPAAVPAPAATTQTPGVSSPAPATAPKAPVVLPKAVVTPKKLDPTAPVFKPPTIPTSPVTNPPAVTPKSKEATPVAPAPVTRPKVKVVVARPKAAEAPTATEPKKPTPKSEQELKAMLLAMTKGKVPSFGKTAVPSPKSAAEEHKDTLVRKEPPTEAEPEESLEAGNPAKKQKADEPTAEQPAKTPARRVLLPKASTPEEPRVESEPKRQHTEESEQ